jgi:predicted Fe-Mo cluster-binding NifX family protein
MRIGIPIWNGRVSPVLDAAERLVVVDTEATADQAHEVVALEARRLPLRAARLSDLNLDLLVCGAVSRPLHDLLAAAGLRVEPWVSGELDEVVRAAEAGSLGQSRYRMPGCCRGRRRARRRRRDRGGFTG